MEVTGCCGLGDYTLMKKFHFDGEDVSEEEIIETIRDWVNSQISYWYYKQKFYAYF